MRIKEGDARGRHVVIVDDLVQSGGTLIECQVMKFVYGLTSPFILVISCGSSTHVSLWLNKFISQLCIFTILHQECKLTLVSSAESVGCSWSSKG